MKRTQTRRGINPLLAVGLVAVAVIGIAKLAGPAEDPGWREYTRGMPIASDEEVITVTARGNSQDRATSEQLRVRIEINDQEVYNQLVNDLPWIRHYVLTYGGHLRIDVSQGYAWGALGCTIHRDMHLLDASEANGRDTASCAYHG